MNGGRYTTVDREAIHGPCVPVDTHDGTSTLSRVTRVVYPRFFTFHPSLKVSSYWNGWQLSCEFILVNPYPGNKPEVSINS